MFSRTAFTVVPITNDDPLDTLLLIITCSSRDSANFTVGEVLDLVRLTVSCVDGTNQHVVGDIVKMSSVLEPRTSHGDVIGGCLSLGLDENRHIERVLSIPSLEWFQNLETITLRRDSDGN